MMTGDASGREAMDKFGDNDGPKSNNWCASGGIGCSHYEATSEGQELYEELKERYYTYQDTVKETSNE